MKKIVITGSSGFIATSLISKLTDLDFEVLCIYNIKKPIILKSKNIKFKKIDIYSKCDNWFEKLNRPDYLIHLAWNKLDDYKDRYHLNFVLPFQILFLENLIINGLKNLFISGTCFEYGKIEGMLSENMKAKPDNNYAKSKVLLYDKIISLKRSNNFNLIWGRLFYIYGVNQKRTIYSNLLNSIKKNEKYFKMSKGMQKRDYLSIDRVADYILSLSTSSMDIGIINICSGKAVNLLEIVNGWINDLNSKINILPGHFPYNDYEAMSFWGSNTKLLKFLKKNISK